VITSTSTPATCDTILRAALRVKMSSVIVGLSLQELRTVLDGAVRGTLRGRGSVEPNAAPHGSALNGAHVTLRDVAKSSQLHHDPSRESLIVCPAAAMRAHVR